MSDSLILVPPIGRIFGIRIGIDTLYDLERRVGKGNAMYPMNDPRVGRTWMLELPGNVQNWVVRAEGTEEAPQGHWPKTLVDVVGFSGVDGGPALIQRMPRSVDLGVFGRLSPGLCPSEVRNVLDPLKGYWEGNTFVQEGGTTLSNEPGDVRPQPTRWNVRCLFSSLDCLRGFEVRVGTG